MVVNNNDKKQILTDALAALNKINLQKGNCRVLIETGYDEAMIVGTENDYLSLAVYLLEIVQTRQKGVAGKAEMDFEIEYHGDVKSYAFGDLKDYFDDDADVFPVTAYITENEDDTYRFKESIKR
jgi:hypothetical protein